MKLEKVESKQSKASCSSIVRVYSYFLYHTGCCIGTYPRCFSIVSVVACLLLGCGLYNFGEINDINSQFTPRNSPSLQEERLAREFLSTKDGEKTVGTTVFLRAKNGGSLLESDHLRELLQLVLKFENGVVVEQKGTNHSYPSICGSYCRVNFVVISALKILNSTMHQNGSNFRLTYPTLDAFGTRIYLGRSFYGVKTDEQNVMISAEMVALSYQMSVKDTKSELLFHKWEKELYKAADDVNKESSLLRTTYLDPSIILEEIRRTGMSALPYLSLSFLLVALFTVISTLRPRVSDSYICATLIGVIGPMLALVASSGVLIGLGIAYQPIVVVCYFLILAIGVDDVYILLHGWHSFAEESNVAVRLGKTLRWSGPSITITSLTDGLSFVVGIFCTTPAIQTFCAFSALAVFFTFIIQITLFCPVLVLTVGQSTDYPLADKLLQSATGFISFHFHRFIKMYTAFLTTSLAVLITVILLVIYWAISLYGWSQLTVDLNTDKLLLTDSPVFELREIEKKYLDAGSGLTSVFVFAPGDLRNKQNLLKTEKMIVDFETCDPLQEGAQSTFTWLRPYMEYLSFEQEADPAEFNYAAIPQFLQTESNAIWQLSLKTHGELCEQNNPHCIEAYVFTTSFRNARSWADKVRLLGKWRDLAKSYSQFNISAFYAANFICDQVSSVTWLTSSSVVATIICMFFVCCIFIPNPMSIACAISAVLSINLGVIGFLTLWDIDLDPIAMAALLMAVGFSVDFTGHISFHFFDTSSTLTVEKKLEHSLDAVSWPMLQAGLSTVVCTSVLALHQSYLTLIFVKTTIVVVGFGLWHGLFILPVLLTNFSRIGSTIPQSRELELSTEQEESKNSGVLSSSDP